MKKKLFGLFLAVTLAMSIGATCGTIAFAGDSPETVTTAADLKYYLELDVNREVILGADITFENDIRIQGNSMSLDLNGYKLTANGKIFLTRDDAALEVHGSGKVIAGNGTVFVVGSVNQDENSTLTINGGTYSSSSSEPIIMCTGTKEGSTSGEGLVINNGNFSTSGTGEIIECESTEHDCDVLITDGEFTTVNANCILGELGTRASICGGSFYSKNSHPLHLVDDCISTGVKCYVDGAEISTSYITFDSHLVQVGVDSAFTDVEINPYPAASVYIGTTPADGAKALIGKTLYVTADCADGWDFVGWATDGNHNKDTLLSKDKTISKKVPDSPSVAFYPVFKKVLTGRTISLSEVSYVYDGTVKKPTVTIGEGMGALVEGTDFEVEYPTDGLNAGKKTIKIKGIGDCEGSETISYTIEAADLSGKTASLSKDSFVYDGMAKAPIVNITGLHISTDFVVSCKDNINVGTATAVVTGKGNYKGTIEKTFTITPADISKETVEITFGVFSYDGSEKKAVKGVGNLVEGKDYDVEYFNNVNAGEASYKITGKGNYTGTIEKSFTIQTVKITELKLGEVGYYDGKKQAPEFQVFCEGVKLDPKDYALRTSLDNKLPGKYKLSVEGVGNYYGLLTETYSIKIKPTTIKSLANGKKSFKVKVEKQTAAAVSGYELRYSLKPGMNKAKTVTIGSKNTAVAKTVSKLKSKKTYYVQVRSMKKIKVGKKYKTYYSDWSEAKTITTK